MAGTVSQALFCLAYARTARHTHWPLALAAGGLAFALSTLALRWLPLSLVPLAVVALASLWPVAASCPAWRRRGGLPARGCPGGTSRRAWW